MAKNKNNDLKKELDSLNSGLGTIRNKIPVHMAPEGYFDQMQNEVIQKVETKEIAAKSIVSFMFSKRRNLAIAASILLVLASYFIIDRYNNANGFDQLNTDDILVYLDENLETLEDDELIGINQEFEIASFEELEETDIDTYLDEQLEELELEELEILL